NPGSASPGVFLLSATASPPNAAALPHCVPAPAWPAVAGSTAWPQESSTHGRDDSEHLKRNRNASSTYQRKTAGRPFHLPWVGEAGGRLLPARSPPPPGATSTDRFRNHGPARLAARPRPPA